eukprot:14365718-Alexandrium_andersonii.AAC.1
MNFSPHGLAFRKALPQSHRFDFAKASPRGRQATAGLLRSALPTNPENARRTINHPRCHCCVVPGCGSEKS